MPITEILPGHFTGASAITHKPSGDDPRALDDLIIELQQGHNTLEAAIGGASDPFFYAGDIALPADFPAAPDEGESYICTADVIDNDPAATNTGQHFFAGSVIWWDGIGAWVDNDPEETGLVSIAATPYTVPDGIHTVLVQTTVIGGPSVVNLPEALAQRVGRKITVIDQESDAGSNPISVTPQGADNIDNVAAAKDIDVDNGAMEFVCGAVGNYFTEPSSAETRANTTRLAEIGAGRQIQEDTQGAPAASGSTRLFRALMDGVILRVAAETAVAAAVGESMSFDVTIGGVSCLSAPIVIDDTTPIDTPVVGTVDTGADDFAGGDLIEVVRTYVPGGGPTPMTVTVCGVQWQFD